MKIKRSGFTLAEGATHTNMLQRAGNGFTLAEVLITLAIIGVVAAMTIPSLIKKYKERVTISKVNKEYSQVANLVKLAINDNDDPTGWNLVDTQAGSIGLANILKPYLKVAIDCGATTTGSVGEKCWTNQNLKYLNGNGINGWNLATAQKFYKVLLLNGVSLAIRAQSADCVANSATLPRCGYILVDIDGPKRGENRLGYDVFFFDLTKNGLQYAKMNKAPNYAEGWFMADWIINKKDTKYKECPTKMNANTYVCNP